MALSREMRIALSLGGIASKQIGHAADTPKRAPLISFRCNKVFPVEQVRPDEIILSLYRGGRRETSAQSSCRTVVQLAQAPQGAGASSRQREHGQSRPPPRPAKDEATCGTQAQATVHPRRRLEHVVLSFRMGKTSARKEPPYPPLSLYRDNSSTPCPSPVPGRWSGDCRLGAYVAGRCAAEHL